MSDKIKITVIDAQGNRITLHGYLGSWATLKQPISTGWFGGSTTLVYNILVEKDDK